MLHTDLIGRDVELAAAVQQLHEDGAVNLFGPPGVGKSRFAAVLVDRVATTKGGCRVATVGARHLATPEALRREVAATLGVAWDGREPQGLLRAIDRGEPTIIVIDDADAFATSMADELAAWFVEAERLSIVTTSMHKLGTPFDFELRPLSSDAARELFVNRARAVRPHYAPDDAELAAVDELLTVLDRLPLAIDLAASRRGVLSPRDILDRIADRFELLRERRGRALSSAVEWAWELLDDELQAALIALAVFDAPFELAAAEAMIGSLSIGCVDAVEALCDRSLLRLVPEASTHGESRFEMYVTIREFVRERAEPPYGAHAEYFISTVGVAVDQLDRGEREDLRPIMATVAELNAIFERSLQTSPQRASQVALLLDRVFARTGTDAVREHAIDRALAAGPEAADCADLLVARAMTRVAAGQFAPARDDLAVALEAARLAGDPFREARALFRAGDVARRCGEAGDALLLLAQALELCGDHEMERQIRAHLACCYVDQGMTARARETITAIDRLPQASSAVAECEVRRRLAYVHFYLGNFAEQHRQGLVALECADRALHRRLQALCVQGLGDSALYLGRLDEARVNYERGLEIHRQLGDQHYEGVLLGNLGTVHHRSDRLDDAAECYRAALAIHRATRARPYEAVVAMSLGMLEVERGRIDEARHHLNTSAQLSQELDLHDDVGAAELALGWAARRIGDHDVARQRFEAAVIAFGRSDAPAWLAIAEFLLGSDVEQARAAVESHGGATEMALLQQAERWNAIVAGRVDESDGDDSQSLHVRVARSVVDAAASGAHGLPSETIARPPKRVLRLSADGNWFEVGDERIDLRRRRAHRLVLLELARRHQRGVVEPLDVYGAFDVGWPNDEAGAEAAADRVYWVVGTLRRLGLRDLLITLDEGYLLAPDVQVDFVH